MKKGCFIKSIIILTILVAAVLYVVKNHLNDFIIEPGKGLIKNIVVKGVDSRLADIKESPEKDSLKILIEAYVNNKLNNIDFSDDDNDVNINFNDNNGDVTVKSKNSNSKIEINIDKIVDSLTVYLKDNSINQKDLEKIKQILKVDNE